MKNTIIIAVILIVLIGGYFVFKQDSRPVESPKVTISEAFEVFLHAPLWVAYEKGFFKDEGLDMNISIAGGDEKAWAAVVKGEAQFAVGDPMFVAISGDRGQQGRVVASILNGMPFWGVAKNPAVTEIEQASDLGTYKVATLPAPSTNYALQKQMFESAGLKPNIQEVAFGALLPALYAGEVDIALEFEPNVSTAVKEGNRIVYSLSDYYPDFAFTGLTATPDYIENNPETTQKIVNAFQRANTYIRTNTEDAAKALAKRFNIPEDIALNALKNLVEKNVVTADTITSKDAWDVAANVRRDLGDLKNAAPYETYVVTTFSQKAK